MTRSAGGNTVSCEDVMLPHPQYSDVNRDVVRTLAVPGARITNFVFWIGIGHDDLSRHDGGAVSLIHVGRLWFAYFLFPMGRSGATSSMNRNGGTHQ